MLDKNYIATIDSIKEQIKVTKQKAILNANKETIFYTRILE